MIRVRETHRWRLQSQFKKNKINYIHDGDGRWRRFASTRPPGRRRTRSADVWSSTRSSAVFPQVDPHKHPAHVSHIETKIWTCQMSAACVVYIPVSSPAHPWRAVLPMPSGPVGNIMNKGLTYWHTSKVSGFNTDASIKALHSPHTKLHLLGKKKVIFISVSRQIR